MASLLLLGLPGCRSQQVFVADAFHPLATRRVAVLPFAPEYAGRNLPTAFVDDVPLFGGEVERGEVYLRGAFTAQLARGAYDLVPPAYVDARLHHAGLIAGAAFRHRPVQELGRLLVVDAVVFGEVEEWDIDYYGVETRQAVAAHVQMIDANTGRVLVDVRASANEGSGLSGGPTGYVSAAAEPLRGLFSAELVSIARDVTRRLAEPFLASQAEIERAGAEAPFLLFAAHDQPADRPLVAGEQLTILAQGAAGMRARWLLGTTGYHGTMTEIDPGLYVGKLLVPAGLVLESEIMTVELESPRGYRSALSIDRKPLSAGRALAPAPARTEGAESGVADG